MAIVCLGLSTAPSAASEQFDWSGLYAGLTLGFGDASISGVQDCCAFDPGDDPDNLTSDGATVGIHFGHNFQSNRMVYGLEADFLAGDIGGEHLSQSEATPNESSLTVDTLASIKGRVGYAFDSRMIFATAGASYVDATYTMRDPDGAVSQGSADLSGTGYVVGVGVEWAIDERTSLRAEYMHYAFDERVDTSSLTSDSNIGDHVQMDSIDMLRLGVSVRF